MRKTTHKKLTLNRNTIRALTEANLAKIDGALQPRPPATTGCYTVAFSCNPVSDCCLMDPNE